MDETNTPTQISHNSLEPHRGILILVLGILSLVICGLSGVGILTGIPAWIMGRNDLRKIKDGLMDPEGKATTKVGMICGIICCVLSLLSIIGIALYIYMLLSTVK